MNDEDDLSVCCVCLEPTISLTPCVHYLCNDCKRKLQKNICPLCRSVLPGEFRALNLPVLRDVIESTSQVPSISSSRSASQVQLSRDGTRQRFSQRRQPAPYRVLLRCELARFKNIADAVACAQEARTHLRSDARDMNSEHARPRVALSRAAAEHMERAPFGCVVELAPQIADLLHHQVFVPELVLPAMRSVVRQAVSNLMLTSASSAEDITGIVAQLLTLRDYEAFFPFVEAVAPQTAQKVIEAAKLALLSQPVGDFLRCALAVDGWPAARLCLGNGLHDVVRNRLMIAVKQMAVNSRSLPLTAMVEALKAVTSCGLLDRPTATQICDELVPCLVRGNVKTRSTITWGAAESGPVVARQFVAKLFDSASDVHLGTSESLSGGSFNFLHLG